MHDLQYDFRHRKWCIITCQDRNAEFSIAVLISNVETELPGKIRSFVLWPEFDFGVRRHRIRTALEPFNGLINGFHFPNPVASHLLFGRGEWTIDNRPLRTLEAH